MEEEEEDDDFFEQVKSFLPKGFVCEMDYERSCETTYVDILLDGNKICTLIKDDIGRYFIETIYNKCYVPSFDLLKYIITDLSRIRDNNV